MLSLSFYKLSYKQRAHTIITPMFIMILSHIHTALLLLSRLPVACLVRTSSLIYEPQRAVWAYPIAGLVIGGSIASTGWILLQTSLPLHITAIVITSLSIVVTGAIHEDGLADSVDGLWGGWTTRKRLDIMRDSHIGTYGVCSLIVVILLRWQGMYGILEIGVWYIIGAYMFSRMFLPVLMYSMPYARTDGIAAAQEKPVFSMVCRNVILGLSGLFLFAPSITVALWAVLTSICCYSIITIIAHRKIGGITGDILGAMQLIIETVCLLCFALV